MKPITGTIHVKRFYLPGFKLTEVCPKCPNEVSWDGDSNYISYPDLDEPSTVHMYCDQCDHAWQRNIRLRRTVEIL